MALIGGRAAVAAAATVMSGRLSRYGHDAASRTELLETELCRFMGVPHTRLVNSGTSALVCGLVGLDVGPGDEVLVPAYTWVSSAAAVLAVGAVPVLVEIDDSLTMDPLDAAAKITDRTKAIMPVHMINHVCDIDRIVALADERGLKVVEDACQAIGVRHRGRPVGSIGAVGAFSFNDHKNMKSGEGGALFCHDEAIFVRASMFHDVGSYMRPDRTSSDEPAFVGLNLKMSEVTASILRPQLRTLDRQIERRAARRRVVLEELARVDGLRVVPHHAPDEAAGLAVQFDDPDRAERFARARGVDHLWQTGRHVYVNWESLRSGRTFHPRFDPYGWNGTVRPGSDDCPRTLDILRRSCNVRLPPDLPLPVVRRLARRMATS